MLGTPNELFCFVPSCCPLPFRLALNGSVSIHVCSHRDEIAACCQRAYERLLVEDAVKLLKLGSKQELAAYVDKVRSTQHLWKDAPRRSERPPRIVDVLHCTKV